MQAGGRREVAWRLAMRGAVHSWGWGRACIGAGVGAVRGGEAKTQGRAWEVKR